MIMIDNDNDNDNDVPKAKKTQKSEQSKARGKKQVNLKRHMVHLKDWGVGSRTRPAPSLCSDYSQEDIADLLNKTREEFDGLIVYSETNPAEPFFTFNAEGYSLMDAVAEKKKSCRAPAKRSGASEAGTVYTHGYSCKSFC